MKQKIVFLDIDGTMVDASGRIPASTKEALRRSQENGHGFRKSAAGEVTIYDGSIGPWLFRDCRGSRRVC